MRLVLKLTLAMTLVLATVLAVHAYLRVQRELAWFDGDMRRDHLTIARVVGWSLQSVSESDGDQQALALLRKINAQDEQVQISWRTDGTTATSGPTHEIAEVADGAQALTTSIPLAMASGAAGRLEIRESMAPSGRYIRTSLKRVVILGVQSVVACVLIILLLGWLLVGRPLRLVTESARRVGEGDLTARTSVRQRDEIGVLARAFDRMCEQLAEAQERVSRETRARIGTLEQLRHAERLSTVGKLASGIAHELGTPLNVVIARARMIERGESTGTEAVEDASIVAQQAERITRVIRQLLDFARRGKPRKEPTNLVQLAEAVTELLAPLAAKQAVTVKIVPQGTLPLVPLDASQIQQVLTNLVVNAIQAQEKGGSVQVELATASGATSEPANRGRPCVQIIVRDEGPGIAPEVAGRVFEPFFTTKKAGVGTGLGLSVAQGIVIEHGGEIRVESSPGKGTAFVVTLPADDPEVGEAA